jgi:hypothetical protein
LQHMKYYLLLAVALPLFILSCKKKDKKPETTNPASAYVHPHTEGSYWVYHWTNIDSLGNETPTSMVDSVFITGDSVVNGHTYVVYEGTYLGGQPYVWLERDSSGYIVSPGGQILYNYVEDDLVLGTSTDDFYDKTAKMGTNASVTLPLGTFSVHDLQLILTRSTGSTLPFATGVNTCGDESTTLHNYYVSGIGKVRMETGYYTQIMQCGRMQGNLVDYHIAP